MNRLSLTNNQLKFKSSGKVPIVLEEYVWNIPQIDKDEPEACSRLDLETLGTSKIRPKKLPGHCRDLRCLRKLIP